MALIIPEESLTTSYPAPQLHSCLQQLPEGVTAYQGQSADPSSDGLRYWLTKDNQSLLLATLPAGAIPRSMLLTPETLAEHPAIKSIIAERDALLPAAMQSHTHHLLPIVLALPDNLEARQTLYLKSPKLLAIGKALMDGAMQLVTDRLYGLAASESVISYIQTRFCPETNDTEQRLDAEQLASLKFDEHHSDDKPFSLRLVTGLSGSGKSKVLIEHAKRLCKRHPDRRILILSYNKAINNQLKHEISCATPKQSKIQCHPFMEWCRKLLGGTWKFVYEDQETELLDLMIKRHFEVGELSRHGLIREINFIKDRRIQTETEYMGTLRSSRSYALPNPVRKRVWQAMIQIDTHLKDRNSHLWGDAPAILLQALDDGKIFESYDYVLIDEAQYFAPVWFELIKRVMAPHAQLFMTADEDQGFCNRSLNWQETGLDLRGHTIRLKHSYRCNQGIARVVDNFRLHRLMEEVRYPLYSINQIDPVPPEQHPQLLHFSVKEYQQKRLLSELHQLVKHGCAPQDILIINANKQTTRFLAQDIRKALDIPTVTLTGSVNDVEAITLCDIESATGLESKVVFITGLERIFDDEENPALNSRERRSLKLENTHLLHMAMTRATDKLYLLITTDEIPEDLTIEGLDIPTLTQQQRAPVMYLNP